MKSKTIFGDNVEIGLLFLESDITFTRNAYPICYSSKELYGFENYECYVSGYGVSFYDGN